MKTAEEFVEGWLWEGKNRETTGHDWPEAFVHDACEMVKQTRTETFREAAEIVEAHRYNPGYYLVGHAIRDAILAKLPKGVTIE